MIETMICPKCKAHNKVVRRTKDVVRCEYCDWIIQEAAQPIVVNNKQEAEQREPASETGVAYAMSGAAEAMARQADDSSSETNTSGENDLFVRVVIGLIIVLVITNIRVILMGILTIVLVLLAVYAIWSYVHEVGS